MASLAKHLNVTSAPSKSKAAVDYILQNLKRPASSMKGARPGFNHALKLSYNTMDPDRLSFGTCPHTNEPIMTYRYPLSKDISQHSVGLWTGLMDELSSVAIFGAKMPGLIGVSLQMQAELVNKQRALDFFSNRQKNNEVDIVNYVSKLGKNITHTRTDFRCINTQDLLAFSSQVKCMPTGNRWADFLLENQTLYDLYVKYSLRNYKAKRYEERPIDDVFASSLDFVGSDGMALSSPTHQATFLVTNEHTNPLNKMHGGCQAMLFEKVGIQYARKQLQTSSVILEAMQNEHMNGVPKGEVEVHCATIGSPPSSGDDSMQVRVQIRLPSKQEGGLGRLCTEAKLRISAY